MTTPPHSLHLRESIDVAASPETLYDLVTDVSRTGERSTECVGARWTTGEPGTVGAHFEGTNRRGEREWTTDCEVVAADRPHQFSWAVVSSTADTVTSVWTYEIERLDGGCRVTERYDMARPPGPLQRLVDQRTPEEAAALVTRRGEGLAAGMRATLAALRAEAEQASVRG